MRKLFKKTQKFKSLLLSSQRTLVNKSLSKRSSLYVYELLSCFKYLNVLVPASKFTSYRESNLGIAVRILKVCISPSCAIGCVTLTSDLNHFGLNYSLCKKQRIGCVKFLQSLTTLGVCEVLFQ